MITMMITNLSSTKGTRSDVQKGHQNTCELRGDLIGK